ncbi:MAG: prepilin-type N-terminal cleavage/methylation domain-containing protein [Pirellulales bacterium]|nr:prepilin-type N-terminal cleavage/methylation domain-containing protein [Pirellulales bacterium]
MSRLQEKPARRGFSLLEVILALSLTTVILLIIGTGVSVQLHAFGTSRARVERAQLARVLLHRMADDLHGLLPPTETSDSALSIPSSADGESVSPEGDDAAATSGFSIDEDEPSDSDEDTTSDDTSSATLCGELDWLRIDVVRAVRREGTSSDTSTSSADSTPDSVGQIETIVYYVVAPEELASQTLPTDSPQTGGGLVRRTLMRPVAAWAAAFGSLEYRDSSVPPLAGEVTAVEFRYYDGNEWLESWDTATTGTLPKAIEIRLYLTPVSSDDQRLLQASNGTTGSSAELPDVQYRLIVPIVFQEASATASTESDTSEESSTESAGAATSESGDNSARSGDTP